VYQNHNCRPAQAMTVAKAENRQGQTDYFPVR
jgi:hypothetical protein